MKRQTSKKHRQNYPFNNEQNFKTRFEEEKINKGNLKANLGRTGY